MQWNIIFQTQLKASAVQQLLWLNTKLVITKPISFHHHIIGRVHAIRTVDLISFSPLRDIYIGSEILSLQPHSLSVLLPFQWLWCRLWCQKESLVLNQPAKMTEAGVMTTFVKSVRTATYHTSSVSDCFSHSSNVHHVRLGVNIHLHQFHAKQFRCLVEGSMSTAGRQTLKKFAIKFNILEIYISW